MDYLNKAFVTAIVSFSMATGCGQGGSQSKSHETELEFNKGDSEQFGMTIPNAYQLASEASAAGSDHVEDVFADQAVAENPDGLSKHIDIQCKQTREEAGLSGAKLQLSVRLDIIHPGSGDVTYERAIKTMECFGDAIIYIRQLRHDRVYRVGAALGLEGAGYSYFGQTKTFSLQQVKVPMNMQRFWGNTVQVDMYFPVSADPADPTPVECNCPEDDIRPIDQDEDDGSSGEGKEQIGDGPAPN